MPFDPARPHDNSTIEADELRDQFNGLRDEYTALIGQIPAGPTGEKGDTGDPGPQGPPGEVTTAQMNAAIDTAIAGTARNPSAFPAYTGTFSDPVTQAEMLAYVAYVDQMRQELVR